MRFILPHQPHLRPAWLIRAGLFLYDHLAKRTTLETSKGINFGSNSPLLSEMTHGFEYSDGWVDDARLVILNAIAAYNAGATVRTRTRCINAKRSKNHWDITLKNTLNSTTDEIEARVLVNATGPWVTQIFSDIIHLPTPKQIRLVKGSHIIVPRIHTGTEAFILQNKDERIIFVIPYEEKYSLIGTTDVEYKGDLTAIDISQDEIDYLITVTNEHFKTQINANDIVWHYSGVRPLLDNEQSNSAQAVSRDYSFAVNTENNNAPLLSVFGGKITTYRKLAETVVNKVCEFHAGSGTAWTETSPLPGGDFKDHASLSNTLQKHYPWLSDTLRARFVRTYGTLTYRLLNDAMSLEDLGCNFGTDLYAAEVNYLIEHEWALNAEDIIWRRTKLGLCLNRAEIKKLAKYIAQHIKASA